MRNLAGKIVRYFFNGTLFIVPLVATIYVIIVGFRWLDSRLNLPYPGVGFIIILTAITLFGYFTTNFAFQTFSNWFDSLMSRIPMVKLIYGSVKDLLAAGFITQSDLTDIGLPDMVVVYFPQSYAFAGDHFVVSRANVKPLNISGSQAMKFIISGGVSGFKETPGNLAS